MSDEFQIQYLKEKCYVCGKTEDDLKPMKKLLIIEVTQKMDELKAEEKGIEKVLDEIISDSYPADYLDFKIHTITSDRKKFADRIPHLELLLKYIPVPEKKRSLEKQPPPVLGDIRQRIIDDPNIFWGNNDFIILRERISFLEGLIQKYHEDPDEYFQLEVVNHQVDDYSNVLVHICPICSGLFYQASNAAYEILDEDDYDEDDW